jgi:hypothetical protein
MRPDWRTQAACAQPETRADDWILDHGSSHRSPTPANLSAAKACDSCPVRIECRDDMLARHEPNTYPLGAIVAGWWWPSSRKGAIVPHPDDEQLQHPAVRSAS